ncbi:4-(cytidine 5'-diphospho)-2-C-methyl-D-erythritol kinase [Sphingobacterium sp. SYP-B4668]|uniref:4-(cytidine 5'-diphospho)-2-C-methyl-D-erythritol kinase n=1 Tax=Sphingobacterium sp. SYP-B4668 TaxID=2996035 RepID=UPI0022DD0268|nr:4-(cytidine 5'-diphospho)-2-C-methyl-D-erythritol kinase [Sphingobacterium sp. SYP-B4668]
MISFPNAKINIGLHIVSRRPDGYHNLESIFYPLKMYDVLEHVERDGDTILHLSGVRIPEGGENLCEKALKLVQRDFSIPAQDIYLHKHIPIGAGLGGGSSDAAFLLKSLNETYRLGLSQEQLCTYAHQLGADCPFFIANTPVYAYDIGTSFESVPLNLESFFIVVVKPDIHISTAEAYSHIIPKTANVDLTRAIQLPVQEWKFMIENHFEDGLFEKYPQIKAIKEAFYESGAVYAAMSGSGSAVYGIFWEETNLDHLKDYGTVYYPVKL